MALPNFLIIGAAKAGTSSVFSYLGQHPEIYTSPIKGPCFFAFEEGQKVEVCGPGDQEIFDRHIVTDRKTYEALFDGATHEKAFGEASVLYLYSPEAPARIKRVIPEAKLIAILRNPVDRAFSSYLHLRRDGRETLDDFASGLKAEEFRISNHWQHLWHYTRVGYYHAQLSRYLELFSRNQIALFTYDEFRASPVNVMQQIFAFLGVDDSFIPNMTVWHNVSGDPKSRQMHRFLTKPNSIKRFVKPLLPGPLRKSMRARALKWNTITGKTELAVDVRKYLVELYRDDIKKLQSLMQKDLSNWLKDPTSGPARIKADAVA